MSQTWNLPINGSDTVLATRTKLNNGFDALVTNFIGPSAPSSPAAGWCYIDNSGTEWPLYIHDGSSWVLVIPDVLTANGGLLALGGGTLSGDLDMGSNEINNLSDGLLSGDAVNKGQVDDRIISMAVRLGDISASTNFILLGGLPACTLQKISLMVNAAITADNTNYWSIQVQNKTASGSPNVLDSARETTVSGGGFTAYTAEDLGTLAAGEDALAADEVLEIQFTKNASASNLVDTLIVVQYKLDT